MRRKGYFPNKGKKYHNKPVDNQFGHFDSGYEFHRYLILLDMQKRGEIENLERQVPYELIPTQREPDKVGKKGGIKKGKVIELGVKYIADFVYEEGNEIVVEDTKGFKTPEYIIKRKLMLYKYGIRIKEV